MNNFFTIILNDIRLAAKRGGGPANLLAFFVIAATLFPFGVGSEPELLRNIGVGVVWVCALLASMLAIPKLFDDDYEDGTLAQLVLLGGMPQMLVLAKVCSHWIVNILPLIIISPLLAVLFHVEDKIIPITIALLVGTPTLAIIGSIGAALTLGLKRGGGLLAILVFPLYIPILIFGVGAAISEGDLFFSNIMILLALLLFMLPVGLLSAAAALKMALEE